MLIGFLGTAVMLKPGTYLGFDFGMRYIGIAVGQSITLSANPFTIIPAVDGIPDWLQIDAVLQQWQPLALVVGLPYDLAGGEQEISFAARKFAKRLQHRYQLPIHLMDERLTTKAAKSELAQQPSGAKTNARVDSVAAKIILESWLQQQDFED